MLILGIDPGIAITGYGLVDKTGKDSFSLVAFGCIKTSAKDSFPQRIFSIYRQTKYLVSRYQPDKIAIENVYFAKNVKTAIDVGQARGVIMLAVSQNKAKLGEFTPLQVKIALTGYGRASKLQVQEMVKKVLHLPEIPKPDDAADALALAITYGQTMDFKRETCNM